MNAMGSQEVRLDRFTRVLLTVIAALLAIIAVELWQASPSMVPAALAQIPDSGAQRNQIIAEGQKTNQLLQDILEHLRTKPIKVQTLAETTDKSTAGRPAKK